VPSYLTRARPTSPRQGSRTAERRERAKGRGVKLGRKAKPIEHQKPRHRTAALELAVCQLHPRRCLSAPPLIKALALLHRRSRRCVEAQLPVLAERLPEARAIKRSNGDCEPIHEIASTHNVSHSTIARGWLPRFCVRAG
jgi:hypothetical protein